MNISRYSRKEVGNLGEKVAVEYFMRHGFSVMGRNIARKTGELDLVLKRGMCLYIVEVKTLVCVDFPGLRDNRYSPEENLHRHKIRKVTRTAEWYLADLHWEGEWQIDAALVWLRARDGLAHVRYIPQIV